MKLFVIPNNEKERTREVLSALGGLAARLPFTLLFTPACAPGLADIPARYLPYGQALEACDMVVVVGGDGTIVHAVKATLGADKPLLGINTGHLGFLSTLEPDELSKLERLLSGGYTFQQRMLLSVEVQEGETRQKLLAFNDAAVTRGPTGRVIEAEISCDGHHVARYRADGVVFSTPSGSTGYALSAGGPVVDPALRLIEMTPVCAHSLFARTTLFAPNKRLCVTAPSTEPERAAYLNVDGEETIPLTPASQVWVTAARETARLVDLTGRTFSEVLGAKILSRSI